MPEDTIQYSAVLADLEERRKSLTSRMESLDAAITGIRALLSGSGIADLPDMPVARASAQPRQQIQVRAQQTVARQAPPPRPRTPQPTTEERRTVAPLNIYVNQHAEWAARQMIPHNHTRSVFRKKTGQCCPSCGSGDTRVSVTKGVSDLFMFLFDYSIARCRNCDTRFRIWKPREPEFVETQTVLE